MPSVFQGICSGCGHKTAVMTEGYGAVWVDEPCASQQGELAGAVVKAGTSGEFAKVEDPRFVVLTHPIEYLVLRSTGYTWSDLFWQGRYVSVDHVVCRNCGHLYEKRKLVAPPAFGCMSSLVLGVLGGLGAGLWTRSIIAGFVLGYLFLMLCLGVFSLVGRTYTRWRFGQRVAALEAEQACPACRADDAVDIDRCKTVRCAACQKELMRFEIVGRS